MNQSRWERVSALYHAAREQPDDARSAFLDRECQGDPDMRAEIQSLLHHDLPSTPAFAVAGGGMAAQFAQVVPGTQIGTYRIESALGAGGMGEVHLATDTRLNRPVALKFVSAAGDQVRSRRFQQEIRAVSSLNHPHILTVHDSGEFAGREYLVTEFVDGGTLKAWRDAEPRTWRQIVELLVGVADALATAHDAGILHRDVKPGNILVARNGYAKLADFGLAKLAGSENQETRSEPHTGAGVVVGTIDYMSPEQVAGRAIDRRSDIFSFGIVLYEMLAGRRPFAGTTNLHVIEGILHDTPQPLGNDVPAPLREVVSKALEKDPGDRYQSMREMVVDLRRLVRQTTEVRPVAASASRGWPARAVGAALVALLAIAIAVAAWFRSESAPGGVDPSSVRSLAVMKPDSQGNDADREVIATGMADETLIKLGETIRSLILIGRDSSIKNYVRAGKSSQQIGRDLGADAFVDLDVTVTDGRVHVVAALTHASTNTHMWGRTFQGDLDDVSRIQADIAQEITRALRVRIGPEAQKRLDEVRPVNKEAFVRYRQGRQQMERGDLQGLNRAVEHFDEAIRLQENYAEAHAGRSWALQTMVNNGLAARSETAGLLAAAEQSANRAIEIDSDLAEAHTALGGVRFELWDWAGSKAAYEKALSLNEMALDCGCYAFVLTAFGDTDRALAISKKIYDVNRLSIDAMLPYAFALLNSERYAEAEPVLLDAQELEPDNPLTARYLSAVYTQQREWDKALSAKAAGHKKLETLPGFKGRVYALSGETDKAKKILADLRSAPHPDYYWIAVLEMALKNTDRALDALDKAVDERQGATRWLKVTPTFRSIHGHPRFEAIVAKLNLPKLPK